MSMARFKAWVLEDRKQKWPTNIEGNWLLSVQNWEKFETPQNHKDGKDELLESKGMKMLEEQDIRWLAVNDLYSKGSEECT